MAFRHSSYHLKLKVKLGDWGMKFMYFRSIHELILMRADNMNVIHELYLIGLNISCEVTD